VYVINRALALVAVAQLVAGGTILSYPEAEVVPNEYIVVFYSKVNFTGAMESHQLLATNSNGKIFHTYQLGSFMGYALATSDESLTLRLSQQPEVDSTFN
jgi:hypothetical protein